MANEQQGQDAAWNDFLEAKRRLLQSMLDFIQAAEKAFEGHVWITLGYPEGMKSWAAYCKDNFGQQATIMRQLPKSDRRQLLLEAKSAGFSDRTVAQIFGVSASTVKRFVKSGDLRQWTPERGHRKITRDSVARLVGVDPACIPNRRKSIE